MLEPVTDENRQEDQDKKSVVIVLNLVEFQAEKRRPADARQARVGPLKA